MSNYTMDCRIGCGACCIAPSISSALPGMFGKPERPEVCNRLQPSEDMCGRSAQEAFIRLASLERVTAPSRLVNFKQMEIIRGDV